MESSDAVVAVFALRIAQPGADLGACLHHAFAALVGTGAAAVVVIGSDAPTLPRAMRRRHPARFDGIAWSTPARMETRA